MEGLGELGKGGFRSPLPLPLKQFQQLLEQRDREVSFPLAD